MFKKRMFFVAVVAAIGCAAGVGQVRTPSTPEMASCAAACNEMIGNTCVYRLRAHPEIKSTCAEIEKDCLLNCPGACLEWPGGRCLNRDEVLERRRKQNVYVSPMLLAGPDGGFEF